MFIQLLKFVVRSTDYDFTKFIEIAIYCTVSENMSKNIKM